MKTQADRIDRMKDGCQLCHQLGNMATRELPMLDLASFDSTADAWEHRIQAGPAGPAMAAEINRIGRPRALELYADWSDRIRSGEVPPAPPRPTGIERNVVLTMLGWGHPRGMVHDSVSTDKRNPTLFPNGPLYGVGGSGLVITDPRTYQSVRMDLPTRIERQRRGNSYSGSSQAIPSLYWADDPPVGLKGQSAHNPMLDDKGRLWITQAVRPDTLPDWCADHPSARYYPIQHTAESRQLSYYDPEDEDFVLIDTCYFTHHLQFADDADDTLWLSGSTEAIGWLNTRLYDETGDERSAQGWCPTVIDTNGDGVITKPWNEPDSSGEVELDATRDTRVGSLDKFRRAYGVMPHPDVSVWISRRFPVPGKLIRLELGDNPPETCQSEVFEPPYDPTGDPTQWAYGPRGIDVDRSGLIWTALGGSGHFASFDRSKCSVLNGPTATGQHCPEGWMLYPTPGPKMKGVEGSANADYHYYSWVDQFDALGLGANVPIATGTTSDALLALLPETQEWVTMRVPYPLGFRLEDVKILLTMQAHWDHTAALAEIKGLTGAEMWATAGDAPVLEDGGFSDPHFGGRESFPPVSVDRVIKEGDLIELGDTRLTVLETPGHTAGSSSYTMTVEEGGRAYDVVVANLGTINPGKRLVVDPTYPGVAEDFADTFRKQKALDVDVWVAAHGSQYGLHDKYQPGQAYSPETFVDPDGLRAAVERLEQIYTDQLAAERR